MLDLSGLAFLDCRGARALAEAARAVPVDSPVIVRSVCPRVRRVLDLLGLDLERRGGQDHAADRVHRTVVVPARSGRVPV